MLIKTFEELKIAATTVEDIFAEVSISNVTIYVKVKRKPFLKSINGFTGPIQGDRRKLPLYRRDVDCLYLWERD